jgi:hypothetical protein
VERWREGRRHRETDGKRTEELKADKEEGEEEKTLNALVTHRSLNINLYIDHILYSGFSCPIIHGPTVP